MEIFLINLDRSTDRLREFERLNGPVVPHVRRVSAIEGKQVSRPLLVQQGIIAADLAYRDGALGNALSHLALWDMTIQANRPLTIAEDDAIFNHGFVAAAEAVIATLRPDWHLILWGWNFDSILAFDMIPGALSCLATFDQAQMRTNAAAFQTSRLAPQPFPLYQTFGTVCYTVSVEGARVLRRLCLPFRNMQIPVPSLGRAVPNLDLGVLLNDVFPRIISLVSFPPLVITRNDHGSSTIQQPPL